jgi:hypothetical protein
MGGGEGRSLARMRRSVVDYVDARGNSLMLQKKCNIRAQSLRNFLAKKKVFVRLLRIPLRVSMLS